MYVYESSTGRFLKHGVQVATGYSGYGISKNRPEREHIRGEGPIPRGRYMIGPARFSRNVGPVAMYLWPVGHDAHGRSALMIHGDNRTQTASRGCIILPRVVRDEVAFTVKTEADPVFLEVV